VSLARDGWHLWLQGTRGGLSLFLTVFDHFSDFSPLVWLAATNLCTILAGSTPRDKGNVQSALLALKISHRAVSRKGCLVGAVVAC